MVTEEHVSTLARYQSNRGRRGRGTNVLSCWLPTSCYLVRYSFVIHSLCIAHNVRRAAVLALALVLSRVPLIRYSFALTLGRAGRTLENAQNNLILIILCARALVPCVLVVPCSCARVPCHGV